MIKIGIKTGKRIQFHFPKNAMIDEIAINAKGTDIIPVLQYFDLIANTAPPMTINCTNPGIQNKWKKNKRKAPT